MGWLGMGYMSMGWVLTGMDYAFRGLCLAWSCVVIA
jgi:hypothetical protein